MGKRRIEVKLRAKSEGFLAQLNCDVLRQNTFDKLHRPLDQPRHTHVTHTIHRDPKAYALETRPAYKEYDTKIWFYQRS